MATGRVWVRCAVTNSDAVNSLKERIAAKCQPLTSPGARSGMVTVLSTRPGELEALVEVAQRDVDAAQDERQHQDHMAGDDDREPAARAELGGKDEETEPDREVGNDERREQDALDPPLQRKLVTV